MRGDDRIPDVGEIGDALPVHQAVAPRALGTAFDGVARHGPGRQQVPVVGPPSEGMNHGREREPGIGHPAGDHDVGVSAQRLHHGPRAEVGVG